MPASSEERRIHELEIALQGAAARIKDLEARTTQMVKETLAETLFIGRFREAERRGRVKEVDRAYWRELFLEDPKVFDIAIAHNWAPVDERIERSRLLWPASG